MLPQSRIETCFGAWGVLQARLPSRIFIYIYGWLIKICGCFSAKPENCEGIFRLKTSAVYQIYG